MNKGLTLVSVLAFLAWSLLVASGVASVASRSFDLRILVVAALYCVGLGASVWVGFFSERRLPATYALVAASTLLAVALFVLSGALLLSVFKVGS
jgi:hypothetical protein